MKEKNANKQPSLNTNDIHHGKMNITGFESKQGKGLYRLGLYKESGGNEMNVRRGYQAIYNKNRSVCMQGFFFTRILQSPENLLK